MVEFKSNIPKYNVKKDDDMIKFRNSKYVTDDKEEIEFLKSIDRVEMVEEGDSKDKDEDKAKKNNDNGGDAKNLEDMDKDEVKEVYKDKFDKKPYYGWDKDELIEKIENK